LNQPVFLFKSIIFLFIFSIPTIQVLDQPEKNQFKPSQTESKPSQTGKNRAKPVDLVFILKNRTELKPVSLNRFPFGFEKK
jgi:hypothetical protein